MAAVRLGRDVAISPIAIAVSASTVTLGGWLVVPTGLAKTAAILCALTAAVASFVSPRLMNWSSMAKCGIAVSLAIFLHRGGVLLLPCWALALVHTVRNEKPTLSTRGVRHLASALLPLIAGLVSFSELWRIFTNYDLPHHLGGQPTLGPGQWWTLSALPLRVLDVINLALFLLPALPVLVIAASSFRPGTADFSRWQRLSMLAVPWIGAVLLIRPGQGVFRDVDVFAPAGIAVGALLALATSNGIAAASKGRLAAIVSTSLLVATVQILLVEHSSAAGLDRVAAYASGPPQRTNAEIGMTWDFLALRSFAVRDWPRAASATNAAVRYEPSPRILIMRGIANTYVGEYRTARDSYSEALRVDNHLPEAWLGLAGAAAYLEDKALEDSALASLIRLGAYEQTRPIIQKLRTEFPAVYPASASPIPW